MSYRKARAYPTAIGKQVAALVDRRHRFFSRFDYDVPCKCGTCGTEQLANAAKSLQEGWPMCCGQTMELVEGLKQKGERG